MSGQATNRSQIMTMLERPACPIGDQATEFGALVDPTAVLRHTQILKKVPKNKGVADIAFRLTATLLLAMIGILMGAITAELIGRIS